VLRRYTSIEELLRDVEESPEEITYRRAEELPDAVLLNGLVVAKSEDFERKLKAHMEESDRDIQLFGSAFASFWAYIKRSVVGCEIEEVNFYRALGNPERQRYLQMKEVMRIKKGGEGVYLAFVDGSERGVEVGNGRYVELFVDGETGEEKTYMVVSGRKHEIESQPIMGFVRTYLDLIHGNCGLVEILCGRKLVYLMWREKEGKREIYRVKSWSD